MYTESQRLGMWDDKVMEECPLFLDFPEGEYPTEEKAQYLIAVEEKNKRKLREVNILTKMCTTLFV